MQLTHMLHPFYSFNVAKYTFPFPNLISKPIPNSDANLHFVTIPVSGLQAKLGISSVEIYLHI